MVSEKLHKGDIGIVIGPREEENGWADAAGISQDGRLFVLFGGST